MDAEALRAVRGDLCRKSLADFLRLGWHVLEPTTPLLWNWHLDALCEHLQATLEDWMAKQTDPAHEQRIRNLLVNIPPGTAKSRVVNVFLPAWMWARWPSWKVICLSANPRVALRDSVLCRELILSDWFQETFEPGWKLSDDVNAKGLWGNTAGGRHQSMGFGAVITGDRADALIVDDPHDAQEVHSAALRQEVLDRWDMAIRNRVNDPRSSVRIGIMQRVHEKDWSGHVLSQDEWEHLCLPMEFEPERAKVSALGWEDPRTEPGELLFPERFPEDVLAAEKRALGSAGYAGQHQQRPNPAEGGVFKNHWWRFWRYAHEPEVEKFKDVTVVIPTNLDGYFPQKFGSWDCSFKDTKDSDFVAGGLWGVRGSFRYLLELAWERMDILATVAAIESQRERWHPHGVFVEDKANGSAVITMLRGKVSGLIAIEPQGGKEARANATAPTVEAGEVLIPLHAEWRDRYIAEHSGFPRAAHDDAVDQQSQLLLRLLEPKAKEQIPKAPNRPEPRGLRASQM